MTKTQSQTFTIRHDQPTGELGTVIVRAAECCAVREPDGTVWVFTYESEWTLARPATARTFTPEA